MSEKKNLDISVVIPVYNAEKTIEICVSSVIKELQGNNLKYEIILINDGSTDSSLCICQKLMEEDNHIIVFSQNNSGPSAARNYGIRCAKGEFLAFNDADDVWLEGKLEKQLSLLKSNPKIDMVCARYNTKKRMGEEHILTYKRQVFYNRFSPQTSVFRRNTMNECFFPENMHYSEDSFFMYNYMKNHICIYMPFYATTSILSKSSFGESGLSSHLLAMTLGGQKGIRYAYKLKEINIFIYFFAITWSWIRFFRRCIITLFLKIKKKVL